MLRSANEPSLTPSPKVPWPVLGVIFLLLATFGPMLGLREFGRTLENLNVATALEIRRDGHWFLPTLEGQPRTKKPPLTAWITALAISPETVGGCSSIDPVVRHAAFTRLAFEVRWPALMQACIALLGAYALGTAIGGRKIGVSTALVMASSYGFVRYGEVAITDVPLMMWVIIANAFIAMTLFQRRIWLGCVGAGVALGIAFMAKGPVALVQTLAPLAVWRLWKMRWGTSDLSGGRNHARPWRAILAGVAAGLVVAAPWYLAMLLRDPAEQWRIWWLQTTGNDSLERSDPRFIYPWHMLVTVFPWIFFWIGGMWSTFRDARKRPWNRESDRAERFVFALCLVVVPAVILTCFKDRKDRYVFPLIAPAAVLTARCVEACFGMLGTALKRDWRRWLHWGPLIGIGLALPLLGGFIPIAAFRTSEGKPWFSPLPAVLGVLPPLAVAVQIARGKLRTPQEIYTATFALMLAVMLLIEIGYRESPGGRSKMRPLAERVWAEYPDAQLYALLDPERRVSVDFSIYMNRVTLSVDEQMLAHPGSPHRSKILLAQAAARERVKSLPQPWRLYWSTPPGREEKWDAYVLPGAQPAP